MSQIKLCANCLKETVKSNKDIRNNKTGLFFCSLSCRQKKLNTLPRQRMAPQGACIGCSALIRKSRKYCLKCRNERPELPFVKSFSSKNIEEQTLREIKDKKKSRPHNRFAQIREHAKTIVSDLIDRQDIQKVCCVCQYNKIVHLCHIKGISSFSDETLISTINDLTNLTFLCPNHHAELDSGLLTEEVKSFAQQLVDAEKIGAII
jgi:hypothetical protein